MAAQEPNWSCSPSPLGLVLVIRTTQQWLRHARGRALPMQNTKSWLSPFSFKPFVRQGGLLGIATQAPSSFRSPSPLGLVLAIRTTKRYLRYAWGWAVPTQNIKACPYIFS